VKAGVGHANGVATQFLQHLQLSLSGSLVVSSPKSTQVVMLVYALDDYPFAIDEQPLFRVKPMSLMPKTVS
jgi:hypothetical protein